jgi:iron complex outermembrane receptor protein
MRYLLLAGYLVAATPALAQRAGDNAVTGAGDAFGRSIGSERVGLYTDNDVRGFSAVQAGNLRVDGLYWDRQGDASARLVSGVNVRIGLTAQGYPFPAPTGVVDYALRNSAPKPLLSTVAHAGPFGGYGLELELSLPVTPGLSAVAGLGYRHNEVMPGDYGDSFAKSLSLRIQPAPWLEIKPFWSQVENSKDNVAPVFFAAGAELPKPVEQRFQGQEWAENRVSGHNVGSIVNITPASGWQVRAGLFQSTGVIRRSFADLFQGVRADGSANHVMIANPGQRAQSRSGELRVSRTLAEGPRQHVIHASLRGRQLTSRRGGSAVVALGPANIYQRTEVARPDFRFGATTLDEVSQMTLGLAYEGRWRGVGEISGGVQRAEYQKTVTRPTAAPMRTGDKPWLFYGSAAAHVNERLALYAGYTRGLEDAGVAPESAANRFEVLPPMHTEQMDAGLRYALRPDLRLIAGVFEISKPYYNFNAANVFTPLGEVRHRGVELSLAGTLLPGLSVVAGAVLMDPRVTGEAVESGRIGKRPVAQTGRVLRANFDYRLPFLSGVSVDLGLLSTGERIASASNVLKTPARTIVDLGARYRFTIDAAPATFRIQMTNVFGINGWNVSSSGGLQQIAPRRLAANLTVDF